MQEANFMIKTRLSNNQEKRYSTRLWTNQSIIFTIASSQEKYSGELINLSTGGISFKCKQKIKQFDKLKLTLEKNQGASTFIVRVLRVTPSNTNDYLIACKINEIIHL